MTQIQKILVIVNQASGVADSFPDQMKARLRDANRPVVWQDVTKPVEVRTAIKRYGQGVSGIIVYGGDGTILTTVKAAYRLRLPILVLPGGTANAFAADLDMPARPMEALELYLANEYVLRHVDVAWANRQPFVLDLHFGSWAAAITSASRRAKRRFGKLAYALKAIQEFSQAQPFNYKLTIDGRSVEARAYMLLIANSGAHEVLGARLFSSPHGRGMVQVALVKQIDRASLTRWFRRRRWNGQGDQSVIATFKAREVIVQRAPKMMIFDDAKKSVTLPLKVTARSEAAMLVVPLKRPTWSYQHGRSQLNLLWIRLADRWQRMRRGVPDMETSLVAPNIYLGGQYDRRVAELFKAWNVRGVINMRKQRNPLQFEGVELLHLPTQDWRAPSIQALREGVSFIDDILKENGAVYIHCRAGEGRGPTMAAAYLIAKGMRTADALAHLRRYRPFANPSGEQRRQLARWQSLQLS